MYYFLFQLDIHRRAGLKRSSRLPSDSSKPVHLDLPTRVTKAPAFPSAGVSMQQLVPYGGGMPHMLNPMLGMGMGGMSMMNPMMMGAGMPWLQQPAVAPAAARATSAAPKKKPMASASATVRASSAVVAAPVSFGSDDDADDSMFAVEDASEAVQFASVKPWVGTVANLTPDNAPRNNPDAPTARLELECVLF